MRRKGQRQHLHFTFSESSAHISDVLSKLCCVLWHSKRCSTQHILGTLVLALAEACPQQLCECCIDQLLPPLSTKDI